MFNHYAVYNCLGAILYNIFNTIVHTVWYGYNQYRNYESYAKVKIISHGDFLVSR